MRLGARAAGPWLAAALVAGCASTPPSDSASAWTSGRMVVRIEATATRAASSLEADFELRGDSNQGELRLMSPLGSRLAGTRWSASEAVLDTGQGETRFPDLEALSRAAFGEQLPLRALPDWLAGRPWPGAASDARADGFAQLGWRVSLAGLTHGRIDAVREEPPRVVVRVRLERSPA
jgi:outer membrane lipoprotein LolB